MAFNPDKVTFFANTDARGQHVPFGIKAKDRQRHMYIIGKTGMGKSTLLENMAVQDIQNGEGMAFIDPHGSAAETLLDYVPEERMNDVIYFAPFDMDNPISFNVMEDVGPDKRHLVVSGLMSTFKKIWVDAWSARMEYILTNALLALIEYPDTTLLSVNRLFSDKAYREKVVDYLQDPAVKAFWTEEFANYTDRFAAEALPAIQNKIGQFTGNPLIRNIIGQPKSSFDIRTIMDERKILIMNLSKGLVGETNANLLGSMLTTRIYLAAMSRADLPAETMKQMPNFYFYVDEFQSFANSTFSNILSEARKYHLNLIIAHQYIAQMEEEVRDAVFGNVGTTIAFRVGPLDAEMLEQVFTPKFLAADLVNLGFAQIYITLMIDGIGSPPFSAVTMAPIDPPPVSHKQGVIEASRHNFTKPRDTVETIVRDLHTPTVSENGPSGNGGTSNKTKRSTATTSNGNRTNNGKSNAKKGDHADNKPAANKPAGSTRDLQDLRAVLGKMAKDQPATTGNAAAGKTKKQPAAPAPDQDTASKQTAGEETATPDPRAELSDALQQVLPKPSAEKKTSSKDAPDPPVSKKQAAGTNKTSSPAVNAATTTNDDTTTSPTPDAPQASSQSATDPLSPQTLKRMMRKGGSNRSPFV